MLHCGLSAKGSEVVGKESDEEQTRAGSYHEAQAVDRVAVVSPYFRDEKEAIKSLECAPLPQIYRPLRQRETSSVLEVSTDVVCG